MTAVMYMLPEDVPAMRNFSIAYASEAVSSYPLTRWGSLMHQVSWFMQAVSEWTVCAALLECFCISCATAVIKCLIRRQCQSQCGIVRKTAIGRFRGRWAEKVISWTWWIRAMWMSIRAGLLCLCIVVNAFEPAGNWQLDCSWLPVDEHCRMQYTSSPNGVVTVQ